MNGPGPATGPATDRHGKGGRQEGGAGFALNTPVEVAVTTTDQPLIRWHRAIIIGRTIEAEPRFDVRLEDAPTGKVGAILISLPTTHIRGV
jgi:predicted sugar kinase